jgi:ABC-type branched-subunit amino acid transport system substrate-binding protein
MSKSGERILRRRRILIVVASLALIGSSCGARFTLAQRNSLRDRNRGVASAGAGLATVGAGADTGNTDATGNLTVGASQTAGSSTGGSGATGATNSGKSGSTGGGALGVAGGPVCPSGAPSTDPGVSPTTITFGNVSTLTGPVPGLFLGAVHGAQAFINYANSQGGVCGRKLALKSVDDNLDPGQNGSQIDALTPQVLGFLGSFSAVDEGGAPSMQKSGVPDVGFALTTDRFNIPNNFSPQPGAGGWPLGALNFYKQKFGPSVIQSSAIFIQNASSAQAQGLAEKAAAESVGYRFSMAETAIEPTQTDFSAEVSTMKSKGVKAIFFAGTQEAMGQMASQMYNDGFSVPLPVWGANAYDPIFPKLAGPGAEGAILNQSLAMYAGEDSSNAEVAKFAQWFHRSFPGSTPDVFAAFSWLSGMLWVQALNAAGAPTRAAVNKALKGITNFDGNGMVAPDGPGNKTPPTCYLLIDVKGGKFVRDPADPPTGFRCGDGGYFKQ